jgi:hypothetical protein
MPSAGFEPAIPAIKLLQTYVLDRKATRIGMLGLYISVIIIINYRKLRYDGNTMKIQKYVEALY